MITAAESVEVAAIQLRVNDALYLTPGAFGVEVEALLQQAGDADLYVFPEYTSAFFALKHLPPEAAALVRRGSVPPLQAIQAAVSEAEPDVHRFWSEVARRRQAYILAGTGLVARGGELYNRGLLYGPRGELRWWQDKVFLGAPEKRVLDLASGSLEDVRTFSLENIEFAVTICRDTYHSVWQEILPDADLWIDIKANELPYSWEYYAGALPARLPNSPIDRGLTVSLVGTMAGYTFSGPTLLHGDRRVQRRTETIHDSATMRFTVTSTTE